MRRVAVARDQKCWACPVDIVVPCAIAGTPGSDGCNPRRPQKCA
jgi:hypothetical protein